MGENFLNEPSKKFYWFFKKRISEGELDNKSLAEKFEKYQSNPSGLLKGLLDGKYSVTTEMILLAQKHYGLNPCALFELTTSSIVDNPTVSLEIIRMQADAIKNQQESIKRQQETIHLLVSKKE